MHDDQAKFQIDVKNLDDRKIKEREHSRKRRTILRGYERYSDARISGKGVDIDSLILDKEAFNHNFSNMKFYSITHKSEQYQYAWLKEKCKSGMKVLDFGCGNGENGIYAAQCGAEVIGIDISPEGIANARLNASQAGVTDHCRFEVMDGENMTFEDNTFDLAVEYGALHHVDLNKVLIELSRVLKPNGEMICVEALKHNPFIHWYRKKTPHLRTQWEVEHILGVEHLDTIRQYFQILSVNFFHLAVLAAVSFRKTLIFKPLRVFLDAIDGLLLNNRLIGKYAWIMIFVIKKSNK